jgi:hypothetical protein
VVVLLLSKHALRGLRTIGLRSDVCFTWKAITFPVGGRRWVSNLVPFANPRCGCGSFDAPTMPSTIHGAGCLMVPLYIVFALFFGLAVVEIPSTELTSIDSLVAFAGFAELTRMSVEDKSMWRTTVVASFVGSTIALADDKSDCLDSKDHDLRIKSCSAMTERNPKDVVALSQPRRGVRAQG